MPLQVCTNVDHQAGTALLVQANPVKLSFGDLHYVDQFVNESATRPNHYSGVVQQANKRLELELGG